MSGNLCEHCTAVCCNYVALPLDNPTTLAELDDIRWYLLHENVSIFVEDGDWYIAFQTRCRSLLPDSRCGVYDTRPRICRNYSTDGCDYHSGDYGWEQHFTAPEHLDEYIRGLPKRGGKLIAARQKRKSAAAGNGAKSRRRLPPMRSTPRANPITAATTDRHGIALPILALTDRG